jgi:hypothetical protein
MSEEIIKLGTVIQLGPHKETEKGVSLGTEDEPAALVSLDDSYEVSGSESIWRITRSAKELLYKHRLDKAGCTALLIAGTESFFPGFDKFNAHKGGESFIRRLSDGFITIVKAIGKWIKDLVEWGMTRLKALFGFAKTEKQIAAAEKHLETIRPLLHNLMVRSFGQTPAARLFDISEFMQSLPQGVTGRESMVIVKNRSESNGAAAARLAAADSDISEAQKKLAEATRNAKMIRGRYRRAVDNLSRLVKANRLQPSDIIDFNDELTKIAAEDLNYTKYLDMVEVLCDKCFGIRVEGLGVEGGFKYINDAMKNNITQIRTAINPDEIKLYKDLQKTYIDRVNRSEYETIDPSTLAELKSVINEKDADVIKAIADKFPDYEHLLGDYLEFSGRMRQYNEAITILGQILQNVSITCSSVSKWISGLEALGMAYVVGDIEGIMAAHEKVTPDQGELFMSDNGLPRLLPDDHKVLQHYYPGINAQEEFADIAKAIRELPQVKKAINNVLSSLSMSHRV